MPSWGECGRPFRPQLPRPALLASLIKSANLLFQEVGEVVVDKKLGLLISQ